MTRLQRPAFAAHYPDAPTIDAMLEAFERGDHSAVRKLRALLAKTDADQAVLFAADDIVARTTADPTVIRLMLLACVLLALLSSFWIASATPPPGSEPRAPAANSSSHK